MCGGRPGSRPCRGAEPWAWWCREVTPGSEALSRPSATSPGFKLTRDEAKFGTLPSSRALVALRVHGASAGRWQGLAGFETAQPNY